MSEDVSDTDPASAGSPPLECRPLNLTDKPATRTAEIVQRFAAQAREILAHEPDANMVLLRGFGTTQALPHFSDVYNVEAAAIATYPVYRGIASLLGMTVLGGGGGAGHGFSAPEFGPEIDWLKQNYDRYGFFYLHYKKTDEKGEDGDFLGKVEAIHAFDRQFARIRELDFEVIVVTGDHATPSLLARHSHHSVPLAIHSEVIKGYDHMQEFTEPSCLHGTRGCIEGPELMTIVLGNAGRLRKFDG